MPELPQGEGVEARVGSASAPSEPPQEEPRALYADTSFELLPAAPRLTRAQAPLMGPIRILDQTGTHRTIQIPAERPLTVYVDKREIVTLMTLGAAPEWMVLGYLINQRLVDGIDAIESITVDWEVESAAVRTRGDGQALLAERTERRIVTSGCGQGTAFGGLIDGLQEVSLPPPELARLSQATLVRMLETMRRQDDVHRRAGSVHGCALFADGQMLAFVEDVGRHNAIDAIAGWMALHGVQGGDKVFYTTGRLTSEMVMKAARMGVPVVVSRNGVTAMGHQLAQQLGMTLFGRAANRHFLCYCGEERFDPQPEAPQEVRVVAG